MREGKRRAIFERFRSANPRPTTELEHRSPFELLIAVMLSAQATDRSVNLATRELFPRANTPEQMVELGVTGLSRHIRNINFWSTKAKHVVETSRLLIERHGGRVPEDRAALEALPGVGRKTANVVLNTAFGHEEIAVDTHIFRVANRTGLAPGATPRAVEAALQEATPREFRRYAHHWLLLHGRYVCKARRPECFRCLIRDLCEFEPKTCDPAGPSPPRLSPSSARTDR